MAANVNELILTICKANPTWDNAQIATAVRDRIPGAQTSARSVSSTKSKAAGNLVRQLDEENPDWSDQQIADEVNSRIGVEQAVKRVSTLRSRRPGSAADTAGAGGMARGPREGGTRYRSPRIGDAQNDLVRNLLGRLGDHSFTKCDWERVRNETFGGRCAYCGDDGELEMEHVVPINMEKLGEHHLGNLVPACRTCNKRKRHSDHADFLRSRPDRKKAIDDHMKRQGYVPLRGDGPEQVLLYAAHQEVRALADRFAQLLNDLRSASRHCL